MSSLCDFRGVEIQGGGGGGGIVSEVELSEL